MPRPLHALVVSTGRDRGALAAARALDRHGWVVGVGTPGDGGMVGASRAVTLRHRVPRPRGDLSAFVTAVGAAVRSGGYDVVFGGGDDWVAALAEHREDIPTVVAHPHALVVRDALDKLRLTDAAHQAGLAAPHTVPATEAALARWRGPVVVKNRRHWHPGQTRLHRIDTRLFEHVDQASERIALIREAGGEPVLQQPVVGRLAALVGVFRDGRLLGRVQQRSDGLWPTPSGMSARARTVAVDPRLAARAESLLTRLGWRGLVELQFLEDESGRRHLIDLNGRFYGSLALAESARPGLVDAWGRLALGLPVPDLTDGRAGVRYSWMAGDLRRARAERRGGVVADVLGTVRWGWGARHSVWDLRDLGPTLQLARERVPATEAGEVVREPVPVS